ncbi:methylated-DNA--[protein]-cysteine S-methyltransferase [Hymenobacter sp. BT683]|uniref:Methylated-DNA--protein-cysteine methyltransferase n=1 Tax=Hymenobacter jeongseonensis TaxID=2791027 RepID=A0ABS0ILH4_9BACT|nr:methylated-DNA--[protein]-cysteine S-methyltransferase [Hymenobacter jeongseonensis]MBF9239219.1 methylated-DNA--[protein]-cysteine S-methyltransferase [Hymenobacter jeongseonensis]
MTTTAYLDSPLGLLGLTGSDAGLSAVSFHHTEGHTATPFHVVPACLQEGHRQLQAYFGRELREFSLTYAPAFGTDFQSQVWQALGGIGYGRTASYLDVAKLLNNPKSVRAVGAANGQNPLAIVWPCHRVIGADGSLTGYAGGMHRKKWLLEFEQPVRQGGLFG